MIRHNKPIEVITDSVKLSINHSFLEFTLDSQSDGVSKANYLRSLAQIDSDFNESESTEGTRAAFINEAVFGLTFSATAVVFSWVLRGGSLLASMLAATRMWSSIDPVKVFNGEKKADNSDEIEEIFDKN